MEDNPIELMEIKKILVPFDNSKLAVRAFWNAINVASKFNSEIFVLSAINSDFFSSSFLDFNSHQTVLENKKIKEIKLKHYELKNFAKKYNVTVNSEVVISSSAAQIIISYIYSTRANMVIMGTRGNGNDKKFMLGSVSLEISQNSPVPVMLVK
jgi:nucleotide-binding universal stress UspA family protein